MARLNESVTRHAVGGANVFSPGVRKGKAIPGSAVESTLESAAERLESGELAM